MPSFKGTRLVDGCTMIGTLWNQQPKSITHAIRAIGVCDAVQSSAVLEIQVELLMGEEK
jgi:hypothetical protein